MSGTIPVRRRRAAAAGLAALAVAFAVAPAARGATSDAEITVSAGSLSIEAADFEPRGTTLTGSAEVVSTVAGSAWRAVDARGTGAPWSVVASAGDLVSSGTPDRVIASSNLVLGTGAIDAESGADPVAGMTGSTGEAFTTPTGAGQTNVTVLDAPGPHRGAYTFTPGLDITIPADAEPSHDGAPYTATLTLTIS